MLKIQDNYPKLVVTLSYVVLEKNKLNDIADNNKLTDSNRNKVITKKVNTRRLGESQRLNYQQSALKILKNQTP